MCGHEYEFDLFEAEENIKRAETDDEYEPKFYCSACFHTMPVTPSSIRGHPPKRIDE